MPGLAWKKLDLHVHTPASACFKGNDTATENLGVEVTPAMIVKKALEKGLDGIAITDHMSGKWIDLVVQAAKDTPLAVFPGVEISVDQYHIVALFERDFTSSDMSNFFGAIGVKPDQEGSTQYPLPDAEIVMKYIHEYRGLAVLAHIDCEHTGAWGAIEKESNKRVLFNSQSYDAVEIKAAMPSPLLDIKIAKNKGYARVPRIAYYSSSDNPCPDDPNKHCIAGIGKDYSWFKVEDICIEGLRQCFIDPEQRIRQGKAFKETRQPCIRQLRVRSEFFGDVRFDFHRGLNCIIGGKGVGKSLVIEFLRLALGNISDIDDIKDDHNSKIAHRLGENGTVTVLCETKSGQLYQVQASVTSCIGSSGKKKAHYEPTVTVVDAKTDEVSGIDIGKIFPIKPYSQSEIIEIARSKSDQLKQLDSFIDISDIQGQIDAQVSALEENLEILIDSMLANERSKELRIAILTLDVEIKAIEKSLTSEVFEKHKSYEDADKSIEESREKWDTITETLNDAIWKIKNWEVTEKVTGGLAKSIIDAISKSQTETKIEILQRLEALVASIKTNKTEPKEQLKEWASLLSAVDKEYKDYLDSIGDDKESLENIREQKTKQLRERTAELVLVEKKVAAWQEASGKAITLCKEIDILRLAKYNDRVAKAEALSKRSENVLRIQVLPGGAVEQAVALLREQRTGMQEATLVQLIESIHPYWLALALIGVHLPDYIKNPLTQEQWQKLTEKIDTSAETVSFLKRLIGALPEDVPDICLLKEGDEYGPLEELSQGQKCTALLILTLLEGDDPVIIDQPEDSLDIRAVWDYIVRSIRKQKPNRQFIFTTHNSSIAVGGDSECIYILEPNGIRSKKTCEGAIDTEKVKSHVLVHLEGGKESYFLRNNKYNVNE